jgi:hypothetical protein
MHPVSPHKGNGIAYDCIDSLGLEYKIRHSDTVIYRERRRNAADCQCRKKKEFFHNDLEFDTTY